MTHTNKQEAERQNKREAKTSLPKKKQHKKKKRNAATLVELHSIGRAATQAAGRAEAERERAAFTRLNAEFQLQAVPKNANCAESGREQLKERGGGSSLV